MDSLKLNAFCTMNMNKLYGSFFFKDRNITNAVYLNMNQNFLIPHFDQTYPQESKFFQQFGFPSHFRGEMRCYFSTILQIVGRPWESEIMATTIPRFKSISFSL